jgi:hypothetical protein
VLSIGEPHVSTDLALSRRFVGSFLSRTILETIRIAAMAQVVSSSSKFAQVRLMLTVGINSFLKCANHFTIQQAQYVLYFLDYTGNSVLSRSPLFSLCKDRTSLCCQSE